MNAILKFNRGETSEFLNYIKNEGNSFKQRLGYLLDRTTKNKDGENQTNQNSNVSRIIKYCSKFVRGTIYLDK